MKLNNSKIDDEMIKHDHENESLKQFLFQKTESYFSNNRENESFQTTFAKNKFKSHFSDHIPYLETKCKTRY
jgi:hypothetical protein